MYAEGVHYDSSAKRSEAAHNAVGHEPREMKLEIAGIPKILKKPGTNERNEN